MRCRVGRKRCSCNGRPRSRTRSGSFPLVRNARGQSGTAQTQSKVLKRANSRSRCVGCSCSGRTRTGCQGYKGYGTREKTGVVRTSQAHVTTAQRNVSNQQINAVAGKRIWGSCAHTRTAVANRTGRHQRKTDGCSTGNNNVQTGKHRIHPRGRDSGNGSRGRKAPTRRRRCWRKRAGNRPPQRGCA